MICIGLGCYISLPDGNAYRVIGIEEERIYDTIRIDLEKACPEEDDHELIDFKDSVIAYENIFEVCAINLVGVTAPFIKLKKISESEV